MKVKIIVLLLICVILFSCSRAYYNQQLDCVCQNTASGKNNSWKRALRKHSICACSDEIKMESYPIRDKKIYFKSGFELHVLCPIDTNKAYIIKFVDYSFSNYYLSECTDTSNNHRILRYVLDKYYKQKYIDRSLIISKIDSIVLINKRKIPCKKSSVSN